MLTILAAASNRPEAALLADMFRMMWVDLLEGFMIRDIFQTTN